MDEVAGGVAVVLSAEEDMGEDDADKDVAVPELSVVAVAVEAESSRVGS